MEFKISRKFKEYIPKIGDEEYLLLEKSILKSGCRDPLVLWNGYLLDGHNRYKICKKHDIPFKTKSVKLIDETEALDWMDVNQLGRRNLTPDQRDILIGRIYNRSKTKQGGDRKSKGQNVRLVNAAKDLAQTYGINEKTVRRAGKKVDQLEELKKVAPKEVQSVLDGEKRFVEVKGNIHRSTRPAHTPKMPKGKYGVVYADPPWQYDFMGTNSRKIENHYFTMDLDEICNMKVQNVCYDDCVLFLWATSPKLEEAFRVIDSWGFTYKTCMVWVKDKIGMGYYARQRHELLLIAAKGRLPPPLPPDRPDSVIEYPRGKHSEKPDLVYGLIEKMFPESSRIELFARSKRKGWKSWGNQS